MKKLKAILVSLPVTSLVFGGVLLATVATTVLQSQSVFAQGSGDAGQVQSAKNTILYAVVGLVVVIMAYAIVNFVINQFQGNGGSAA